MHREAIIAAAIAAWLASLQFALHMHVELVGAPVIESPYLWLFAAGFYGPLFAALAAWVWWPNKDPAARPWTRRVLFWLWVIGSAIVVGIGVVQTLSYPSDGAMARLIGLCLLCAIYGFPIWLLSVGIGLSRRVLRRGLRPPRDYSRASHEALTSER